MMHDIIIYNVLEFQSESQYLIPIHINIVLERVWGPDITDTFADVRGGDPTHSGSWGS